MAAAEAADGGVGGGGGGGEGGSIFVSVASYRDNQCQYTIQDLFRKARRPERVVVGVCFQVAREDEDSFLLDLGEWSGQIRTYFISHTEAMGPCYARALIHQHLFKDEDYYFQIDSHMRFPPDWDAICLEQLQRCPGPKPILTAYASSYTLPKDYEAGKPDQAVLASGKGMTVLCADGFGDQHRDDPFLRIKTRSCRSDFGHRPPPAPFWTARFAFSRGHVVREVPYDPHLEYIFFGEEIAMSARLWTAGWDFFNPTKVVAYHLASRAHRQWFREVQTSPEQLERETRGKYRICGLLGTPWPDGHLHEQPPEPYGLGRARSLAEYERFAGVDFKKQIVHERARNGGIDPELLPPQWAEEERNKMMQASQMQDVASWAGKDNEDALRRHLAQTGGGLLDQPLCAPVAAQPDGRARSTEAARARELTRVRIQALQASLHAPADEAAGTSHAETQLELCRAFCSLGQVEAADGAPKRAEDAYARAVEHAGLAREAPPFGREHDASWHASVAHALGSACLGCKKYREAKSALGEALPLAAKALLARPDEASEQLAHDVVEGVHVAHEQTDDRKGLEGFIKGLQALLSSLKRVAGEAPAPVPVLTGADDGPPPPPGGGEGAAGVRARLLERVALICVATGRERDMELVKKVYTDFRIARESPGLRRLLGMLQSSGHFLDL